MALAPVLALALASSGCDEEPDCGLSTLLSGAFDGPIALNAVGRGGCGFANAPSTDPNSSAIAFVDGETIAVFLILQTPVIAAGEHVARVKLVVDGNTWESEEATCAVGISEFTREEWSKIDFFRLDGVANCSEPLISTTPGVLDVTASTIEFDGHLHAEVLDFDL